jgi:hypothetical protein
MRHRHTQDNNDNGWLIPRLCASLRCYPALLVQMNTWLDDKDNLRLAMLLTMLVILLIWLTAAVPAILDVEA